MRDLKSKILLEILPVKHKICIYTYIQAHVYMIRIKFSGVSSGELRVQREKEMM